MFVLAFKIGAVIGGSAVQRMPLDFVGDAVVILRAAVLLDEADDAVDLHIVHKTALHTGVLVGGHGMVQHIAVADQIFRAAHVQNGTGVNLRGNRKRDAAGDIVFDGAGNDVYRRALGGKNHVHTRRTRHRRQPSDGILHFLGRGDHQIRHFVDHNHNAAHLLKFAGFLRQTVVIGDVSHAALLEHTVALEHFAHRPLQCARCLFGFAHYRHQQMGNAVVHIEFDGFGVDEHHAHFGGRVFVENTHENGIDTDRFTRTGGTRDEQMRHFREVTKYNMSLDVLAECHGQ